jgi:hypothetical protein
MKQYSDYLKAALLYQLNIVVFSGLALLSLVSWNLFPLLVACAAEGLWLLLAPVVPAFRAQVEAREKVIREFDSHAGLQKTLDDLPAEQLNRFRVFAARVNAIKEQSATLGGMQQSLVASAVEHVDDLKTRYGMMLAAETQMAAYLKSNDLTLLNHKLVNLASEIETASGRLRSVKAQQKEILVQRLGKLRAIEENATLIKAQLESFEDLVQLLTEQTMTMGDPQELNAHVDSILARIEVADSVLSELDESSLAAFDRQLDIPDARSKK